MYQSYSAVIKLTLRVRAIATVGITQVVIVRNHTFDCTSHPNAKAVNCEFVGQDFTPGQNYYYVRAVQIDRQAVWNSPIWIEWENDFIRTRIFDPLGMKDSFFYLPEDRRPRLASNYTLTAGKLEKTAPNAPISAAASPTKSAPSSRSPAAPPHDKPRPNRTAPHNPDF